MWPSVGSLDHSRNETPAAWTLVLLPLGFAVILHLWALLRGRTSHQPYSCSAPSSPSAHPRTWGSSRKCKAQRRRGFQSHRSLGSVMCSLTNYPAFGELPNLSEPLFPLL